MRLPLCNNRFPPLNSLPPPPSPPCGLTTASLHKASVPQKAFITTGFSVALSLGLLISPPSIASEFSSDRSSAVSLVQTNEEEQLDCREDEQELSAAAAEPEVASNEGIVSEVWQIVNDSFLNTSRRSWSPEIWRSKKEDILSTSIQSRPRAHDIIRRMLASLGDPYTRFLSPAEFSKMARYDMTGIGINLREVPGDNQDVKLKVLGLLLDGPAHSAGVRQGDELLSVNGMDVKGKSAFEASSLIQGPSGTIVNIMVKHGKCGPVQSIDVERQSIARTPVFYRLEQIENGSTLVGYVRLKEFNALARKDLVTAMKRLQGMGASSFVLDLRDNLGGLVQVCLQIELTNTLFQRCVSLMILIFVEFERSKGLAGGE
nr:carboxyl-terminal-processing peptidase 1, chloroplastic [Ipomoea batatas]